MMTPSAYIRAKGATARRYAQHRVDQASLYIFTAQTLETVADETDGFAADAAARACDTEADRCREHCDSLARVLDATADEIRMGLHEQ